MQRSLTKEVTQALIDGKAIKEDERELYEYCVGGLVEMGANILFTLLLGLVFGKLLETIIFLAIIIPLRTFAGGYHAPNAALCFVMSIVLYIFAVFSVEYLSNVLSIWSSVCYFFFFAVIIMFNAPVECKNKRLSDEDKKRNERNCIIVTLICSGIISLMGIYGFGTVCFAVTNSFAVAALLVVSGKIKNRLQNI